jgi:phenylpyruvate tautomerase PptA (4-oxalocrotonate tautomerase family)
MPSARIHASKSDHQRSHRRRLKEQRERLAEEVTALRAQLATKAAPERPGARKRAIRPE